VSSSSKPNGQYDPRLSVSELEEMHTHDLAALLSNVVLVLRRLPNVPVRELAGQEQKTSNAGDDLVDKASKRVNGRRETDWWAERE
jgi:hypothetical protein